MIKSLFKNPISSDARFQAQIENAHKYECLSVGLLQCFELEAREDEKANQYFKNLFNYIQQSQGSLALLISSKLPLPFKMSNKWARRLQGFIEEKQPENTKQFQIGNECIKNIATNVINQFMVPEAEGPSKVYQEMLNKLYKATLANLPNLGIIRLRELVFNLQYAELNSPERIAVFSGLGVDLTVF